MIQQTAHLLLLIVASAPVDGHSFEDASRAYRIETYDTFRAQRPEFDRRQQLGTEATRRWKEARFDTQLRDQIVTWFVESTDATQKGVNLPELPGEPSRASRKEAAAREAEARANTESTTREISIVTDESFIETNEGRDTSDTVKILGSVGRAMTHAFFINRDTLDEVTPSVNSLEVPDFEGSSSQEDEATTEQLQALFDGEV